MGIFGAVWRIGTKVGAMTQELKEHDQRLAELGQRIYAHDQWHLQRGDR